MIKNKIVVGILPTFVSSDTNPYANRDTFVKMYQKAIIDCGGIPIGILDDNIDLYLQLCDAFVWPGGNIMKMEFFPLIDDAIKNNKPILGICLGSQSIATYFNILSDQKADTSKNLYETYCSNKLDNMYLKKLEDLKLKNHNHIVTTEEDTILAAKHKINITKDTFLYDIYKRDSIDVVSLHSFEIPRLSSDVIVSAKSDDDVIEAVEYHKNNSYILGLQYHPELIKDYEPFKWLIKNAYNKYKILINKDNKIEDNKFKIIKYNSAYPKCSLEESNLEEQTYYSFLALKEKMKELGFIIDLESGYRSHEFQKQLFDNIANEKGLDHAKKYVATQFHSEHESGLAIDVCALVDGIWHNEFDKELDLMYQTLHKIMSDYGFILRYPKNKENITKYNYEPWHLRYVGDIEFAKKIMNNNKCLEEELDVL